MAHKNRSLQWACDLTARPERVLWGETAELRVSLSHQKLGEFNRKDHAHFFGRLEFTFNADHPELNAALTAPLPQFDPAKNCFTFRVPNNVADGPYGITVTVKTKVGVSSEHPLSPDETEALGLFPDEVLGSTTIRVANRYTETRADVTLHRTSAFPTSDEALWVAIRNRTAAVEFDRYHKFIDRLFSNIDAPNFANNTFRQRLSPRDSGANLSILDTLNIYGPYAYSVLKFATQAFLILESGVVIEESHNDPNGRRFLLSPNALEKERIRLEDPTASFNELRQRLQTYFMQSEQSGGVLPYLDRILSNLLTLDRDQGEVDEVLPYFNGVLQHRLTSPSLIELIWSYWHEEGMLVQTMNTVALRFQNRRSSPNDPLGELELDPLRPLNNLMWGYIQDEHNRLTVPRRGYEYQHHYGLSLVGKALSGMIPADVRSKFIEAFHNLLYRTAVFYREDSDTTVIADAFPLLNALKEVHLLLAEGAHNQFGDLPWTARGEMLMMQWLLARPEMREFLRGRYMVPYQELWMGAVDSMKKLQGWTDTTVTHFHELAVTGERILLSARYGDWIDIENTQDQAKNWARYWKPEIQRYIHGYQTATGVDLMAEVTDTRDAAQRSLQPSALLQRRLAAQTRQGRIAASPRAANALTSKVSGFAELPAPQRGRLLRYREDE